jgi:hypothetical protein
MRRLPSGLVADRRAPRLAAPCALDRGGAHQPLDRAARHAGAFALSVAQTLSAP